MRSGESDVGVGDRRHSNEVVCPGQECREGRGERDVAAHADTDSCGDHLLLRGEYVEVPLRMLSLEQLGVC
jgi:hypothetical protein